jgi:hypothetical protein
VRWWTLRIAISSHPQRLYAAPPYRNDCTCEQHNCNEQEKLESCGCALEQQERVGTSLPEQSRRRCGLEDLPSVWREALTCIPAKQAEKQLNPNILIR